MRKALITLTFLALISLAFSTVIETEQTSSSILNGTFYSVALWTGLTPGSVYRPGVQCCLPIGEIHITSDPFNVTNSILTATSWEGALCQKFGMTSDFKLNLPYNAVLNLNQQLFGSITYSSDNIQFLLSNLQSNATYYDSGAFTIDLRFQYPGKNTPFCGVTLFKTTIEPNSPLVINETLYPSQWANPDQKTWPYLLNGTFYSIGLWTGPTPGSVYRPGIQCCLPIGEINIISNPANITSSLLTATSWEGAFCQNYNITPYYELNLPYNANSNFYQVSGFNAYNFDGVQFSVSNLQSNGTYYDSGAVTIDLMLRYPGVNTPFCGVTLFKN